VSKGNLEAKLRARLGEWEAYGETPPAPLAGGTEVVVRAGGDLFGTDLFGGPLVVRDPAADQPAVTQDYRWIAPPSPSQSQPDASPPSRSERTYALAAVDPATRRQGLLTQPGPRRMEHQPGRDDIGHRAPWSGNLQPPNYNSASITSRNTTILLAVLILLIGAVVYCVAYLLIH
jgi:hypothetical protein